MTEFFSHNWHLIFSISATIFGSFYAFHKKIIMADLKKAIAGLAYSKKEGERLEKDFLIHKAEYREDIKGLQTDVKMILQLMSQHHGN